MKHPNYATWLLIALGSVAVPVLLGPRVLAADSTCTITLGPRTACVTPRTIKQARADGGIIDVQQPASNVLLATLTGTVATNAILGCESMATQTFHLEQEFEIAGPETGVRDVALTLESTLVGLVRARHKGAAGARLASAKICPVGWPDSPLIVVHPPFEVQANDARLCNQRLAPIKIPTMPVGMYLLVADFALNSDAAGLTDGHSAADFSPTTVLPADWIRARDPFQGVDKKDFGFRVTLTAEPAKAALLSANRPRLNDPKVVPTSISLPTLPPARTTGPPQPTSRR